jgi:hypothetical protein
MNFGGSRLGFWFRYPLGLPDRALSNNNVLVFYEDNGLYYDVDPATQIWPIIQAQEIALGMNPIFIVGYNNLPEELTAFSHVWDIGYNSPYISPIIPGPPNPTDKLLSYLQAGGGFFMLGENSGFFQRDNAIETFVGAAGGGTITYDTSLAPQTQYTLSVQPDFLIANQDNTVTFAAPGLFDAIGTGTSMTTSAYPGAVYYPAVCWETGSLTNAPKGCIVSVLDINFIAEGAYLNTNFVDNIILTMNQR